LIIFILWFWFFNIIYIKHIILLCSCNININKNLYSFKKSKRKNIYFAFRISKNRSKLNRIYLDRIGSDFLKTLSKPNQVMRSLLTNPWLFNTPPKREHMCKLKDNLENVVAKSAIIIHETQNSGKSRESEG